MLIESYNKIATYITGTFGPNFILLIILLTTAVSIAYFIVISYVITQMDKRYFVRKVTISKVTIRKKSSGNDANQNPHLMLLNSSTAFVFSIAKIFVGVFLLMCGVVMLVLPGQGLITIVIGLSLIPFPGKNKIEKYLLSQKSVRSSLNWIRIKANKEPFIFD
ncbi:MAG: hypothetical protein QNK36_11440 [Colwellia sp.]|nr:hypothetical protein [Colwellia sp.]